LDDSGTHLDSPYTVVEGVVFPEEKTKIFEETWRSKLAQEGIKIFHGADCDAARGEFEGWSKTKSRAFTVDLARIISSNAEFVMARGLKPEDFFRAWDASGLKDDFLKRNVYRSLLQLCFHYLGGWAHLLPANDAVAIFVEIGQKRSSFINDLYGSVNNNTWGRHFLKTEKIRYVSKSHAPLQAADLLVHEVFKYHPYLGTDTIGEALEELTIKHGKYEIMLYDFDGISLILREIKKHENNFIRKKSKQKH
jgi:hypothetical protein